MRRTIARITRLVLPVATLVGVVGLGPSSTPLHAAPTPATVAVAPTPAHAQYYVDREATAPAAVRQQLANIRKSLPSVAKYTVGYTTAMDVPLEKLAATKVPSDIRSVRDAWAPVQKALLDADAKQKADYYHTHPTATGPATEVKPPFTATSARGDWRVAGVVSPIRDQKLCGSCWAFAIMGAYEASLAIRGTVKIDASEQALLSCAGTGSCGGGDVHDATNWFLRNGTTSELAYPYSAGSGTTGTCKPFSGDLKLVAWGYPHWTTDAITGNGSYTNDDLKDAIVTHGPIVVTVYANDQMQAYTGGVFSLTPPVSSTNHAVVLVGWDDAKGAWIVRNSWGTGWGESAGVAGGERGYMYLAYGSANVARWVNWVKAPLGVVGPSGSIQSILDQQIVNQGK